MGACRGGFVANSLPEANAAGWTRGACMKRHLGESVGPRGGVRAGARGTRGWRWSAAGALVSAPVRCRRAQWYLARGKPAGPDIPGRVDVLMRFVHADQTFSERCLSLHARSGADNGEDLLGWVRVPDDATHLQLRLAPTEPAGQLAEVVFHYVSERDPKCHPLANVPRWRAYQPPFPLRRVVLPPSLEGLAPLLAGQTVEILRPRSAKQLVTAARGAACVLDPAWVRSLRWNWRDLERLAEDSWVLVDLETVARLLRGVAGERFEVKVRWSPHGIMSARVEYADVPTRGFALQDVFPYGGVVGEGAFALRVLVASRAWRRYADAIGFATLLASETPDPDECGDVLSAAYPIGGGELIATDVPWLAAGAFGQPLAPRLTRHILRMHLGAALPDEVQYWNRWDDSQIVVRDISDLARRYPPLQAVRWAAPNGDSVALGVALPGLAGAGSDQTLLLRTGRIDNLARHPGLPPEPLVIFMKMLAREAREHTAWARRYLGRLTVVWQFDSAAGLRYAANYASAVTVSAAVAQTVLLTRGAEAEPAGGLGRIEVFADDEGLFGDGALEYQGRLSRRLRGLIERAAAND
jgi:hypothetical protein